MGYNGRQWETMGDKGGKAETKGRQGLGKADTQSNTSGKTMGGKGRQDLTRLTHHPTQAHLGRQWERRGNKTLGRRTDHPTNGNKKTIRGDKGRQDLRQADTPSNTCGETMGDNGNNGRQWETRGDTGRQRETRPIQQGNKKG